MSEYIRGAEFQPRPGVTLHVLDDNGVLFDPRGQQLYVVNGTATLIWMCLADRLTQHETVEWLVQARLAGRSDAERYVARIIDAWLAFGLLDGSRPVPAEAPAGDAANARPVAPRGRSRRSARPHRGPVFQLLDMRFRLTAPMIAPNDDVRALLSPLAMAAEPEAAAVDVGLSVRDGDFELTADGEVVDRCRRRSELVPMVRSSLIQLAFRRSDDFAAVHAAAVATGDCCLLLPGSSGSGKSTLAAALVSAGLQLLGDDTVVLSATDLSARAVPFPICLKPGALSLLADRFPELAGQPVHDRLDGKRVRFLPAPHAAAYVASGVRRPVRAIVFPCRAAGSRGELVTLPAVEALERLLRGFYPLGAGLDAARVDQLLRWIGGVECLELRFRTLDEGVAALRGL